MLSSSLFWTIHPSAVSNLKILLQLVCFSLFTPPPCYLQRFDKRNILGIRFYWHHIITVHHVQTVLTVCAFTLQWGEKKKKVQEVLVLVCFQRAQQNSLGPNCFSDCWKTLSAPNCRKIENFRWCTTATYAEEMFADKSFSSRGSQADFKCLRTSMNVVQIEVNVRPFETETNL